MPPEEEDGLRCVSAALEGNQFLDCFQVGTEVCLKSGSAAGLVTLI